MGIKQSIVIVNEFTYKPSGSSGTRGASPGAYVMRYMARDKATENLAAIPLLQASPYPVSSYDQKGFITKYMARESASESVTELKDVKKTMTSNNTDGVAFGYGSIALTKEQLKEASDDIQNLFDNGKTVMKTVISFDEKYLKENGVVDDGFKFKSRGDYRGNIDQMKLRQAIMHGCDKLGRQQYDDLRYIGVIQVDTAHVHCHLAMVDAGKGNLTKDGYQKGKISELGKRIMRRGIDMSLDEMQKTSQLQSNVSLDRRHAICYIKKYTHQIMEQNGLPQFLMACLPENKSLWRAGSHAKVMRKPNQIVREFVIDTLQHEDSGYKEALQSVDNYCKRRQKREGFDYKKYRELYSKGQNMIISDCMNSVYSVLKKVPEKDKVVRTPIMEAMSQDYEQMAAEAPSDKMVEFGFKLRSYSSRLSHHKIETHKYHDAVKNYKATPIPDPASISLLKYFEFEEEYNSKLMCKYQYFLSFLPSTNKFEEPFNELISYKRKKKKLEDMYDDEKISLLSDDAADEYGYKEYGHKDGHLVNAAPNVIERRIQYMATKYNEMKDDFEFNLADDGFSLEEDVDGNFRVSKKKKYSFDEVKALDLHHLGYDFSYDVLISKKNRNNFVEVADKRYSLYIDAIKYLHASNQDDVIDMFPNRDIKSMKEMADSLRTVSVMKSNLKETDIQQRKRSRTFTLDFALEDEMRQSVIDTVHTTNELDK